MMQSLSPDELLSQLTEQHIKTLNKFFSQQSKYSHRHQRLISLLELLKKQVNDYNSGVITNKQNVEKGEMKQNEGSFDLDKAPSTPVTHSKSLFFSNIKTSPSIDFFMLYVSGSSANASSVFSNLDKEW
jgi:hypothetical protein